MTTTPSTITRRFPYAPEAPTLPQNWNIQAPSYMQSGASQLASSPFQPTPQTPPPTQSHAVRVFGNTVGNYTTPGLSPDQQQLMQKQADLLGPFAGVIMGGQPLTRGDLPLLETNLNFQQMLLAEADRQRAYQEMMRGRGDIGTDPNSTWIRNLLTNRASAGGPFDEMLRSQIEGGMRNQAALGLQGGQRRMTEDFARRGLGGSATEYQQAAMQQQAGAGLASQIGDFRQQAALANEAAMQQYGQMLQQQAMQEAAQRAMFDEMIAKLFSETERAPIDLSALMAPVQGYATPLTRG